MDAQPRESDEREKNRPRVRRLSWWFAFAVVGGVAAAIAGRRFAPVRLPLDREYAGRAQGEPPTTISI